MAQEYFLRYLTVWPTILLPNDTVTHADVVKLAERIENKLALVYLIELKALSDAAEAALAAAVPTPTSVQDAVEVIRVACNALLVNTSPALKLLAGSATTYTPIGGNGHEGPLMLAAINSSQPEVWSTVIDNTTYTFNVQIRFATWH